MCDFLGTLLQAGGGILSAIGQRNAGMQADLGGQITAGVMADNARIQSGNADLTLGNVDTLKKQADVMRESADVARAKARVALARTQDQGEAAAGDQVAHFASSNLDATSGSPLLLQLLNASRVKGDMDLISRRRRSRSRQHPHQCGERRRCGGRRGRQGRRHVFGGILHLRQRAGDATPRRPGAHRRPVRRRDRAVVSRLQTVRLENGR
jgi:hypothetical protein